MSKYASPELIALDKKEGKPLDLLAEICEACNIPFERPIVNEGDKVAYEHKGIRLDPFVEPNAIIFGSNGTFVFFEQLSKITGLAGRVQSKELSVDITSVPQLDYKMGLSSGCRILLQIGKWYIHGGIQPHLRIYFESYIDNPGGRGANQIDLILPDYLPVAPEKDQTIEIRVDFKHDLMQVRMSARINVWH